MAVHLAGNIGCPRKALRVLVLFCLSLAKINAANNTAANSTYTDAILQTSRFLQQLADAKVLSGSVAVQKDGQLVYSDGFGWASEELGVPMKDYHIFPIGSNTKFFTAVCIYQLQEKGLLNVTDAVNLYIDPADFDGLGNLGWCPLIYGKEQLGCQLPTIKQLLEMSSGLLPSDNMGCGTANLTWTANDWFWQYRLSLNELLWGDVSGVTGNLFNGSYTATQQLNAQKTLLRPMLFAPGEQYCYTNSNFNLAAYVVEKLSNMSFTQYVTENIIKPANLTNTYYWIGGQGMEPRGIRKNVVSIPGYVTTFRGSKGGGAASEYLRVNRGSWWEGDLAYSAAAAGAMFAPVEDLLRWYNTFTAHPEVVGLSKESLKNLTTPWQVIPVPGHGNVSFGQGIVAAGDANLTRRIMYIGGIWGFSTQVQMWLNHADPTKSDAVLFFSNLNPAIPAESKGVCAVKSPANGDTVQLSASLCGGDPDAGKDISTYVTDSLARMWNISQEASDTA